MAKKHTKLTALFLSIVMLLSTFSLPAIAVDDSASASTAAAVSSMINKTASGLDENDQTDVTLTVPGMKEGVGADIVFVMGSSVGSAKKTLDYLKNTMRQILVEFEGTGAQVKLGLVSFQNTTEEEIVLPLTVMEEDTMDAIIENAVNSYASSGVNMESALATAKQMLDADTTVPAERKHLILISTGYSWTFDDENGNVATIAGTDVANNYTWGQMYYCSARNGSTNTDSGMYVPFGWTWEKYWDHIEKWVEADGDQYVYTLGYNDENGDFVPVTYKEMYLASAVVDGTEVYNNVQIPHKNCASIVVV